MARPRPQDLQAARYLAKLERADGLSKVWLLFLRVQLLGEGKPFLSIAIHSLFQIGDSNVEAAPKVAGILPQALKVKVQSLITCILLVSAIILILFCFLLILRAAVASLLVGGLNDLEGTPASLRL